MKLNHLLCENRAGAQEQTDLAGLGPASAVLRSGLREQMLLLLVDKGVSRNVPGAGVGPSTGWTEGPVPSAFLELYALQLVSYFYKIPITQQKDKHHIKRK